MADIQSIAFLALPVSSPKIEYIPPQDSRASVNTIKNVRDAFAAVVYVFLGILCGLISLQTAILKRTYAAKIATVSPNLASCKYPFRNEMSYSLYFDTIRQNMGIMEAAIRSLFLPSLTLASRFIFSFVRITHAIRDGNTLTMFLRRSMTVRIERNEMICVTISYLFLPCIPCL